MGHFEGFMWSKTQAWEMWHNGWPACGMLFLTQLNEDTFIYGGWVCNSVLDQHCGKYHICREKMQLTRAKPGNPASNDI